MVDGERVATLRRDDRGDGPETVIPSLWNADVRGLPAFLDAAAFAAGPVDGSLGPQSRAVLAGYQTVSGQPATGHPDKTTRDLRRKAWPSD